MYAIAEEINLKFNWVAESYRTLSVYEIQVNVKTIMWDDVCNGKANPGSPFPRRYV